MKMNQMRNEPRTLPPATKTFDQFNPSNKFSENFDHFLKNSSRVTVAKPGCPVFRYFVIKIGILLFHFPNQSKKERKETNCFRIQRRITKLITIGKHIDEKQVTIIQSRIRSIRSKQCTIVIFLFLLFDQTVRQSFSHGSQRRGGRRLLLEMDWLLS